MDITTSEKIEAWLTAVEKVDWNGDFGSLQQCDGLIAELISTGMLTELIVGLPNNASLIEQCEQLQGLKKLVLIDDLKRDIRLRLHLFEDYAFDVAHNHKWSFHSTLLGGKYLQSLHGEVREGMTASHLDNMPVVTATEYRFKDSYFLRHNMVHSLRAEPQTMTLVIRGPIGREYSLWKDFKNSDEWTHKGDKTDVLKRTLTTAEIRATADILRRRVQVIRKDF